MSDRIFWTPIRLDERRHYITDTPQSELHIPSPAPPCGERGGDDTRIGGRAPRMEEINPNCVIDFTRDATAASRAKLTSANVELAGECINRPNSVYEKKTPGAERLFPATCKREGNENREDAVCLHACASTSFLQRAFGDTEASATPHELYTDFCSAAGSPQDKKNDLEKQQIPRVQSPIPERPEDEMTVSTSMRGLHQRLGRRITSPLPDDDDDGAVKCAKSMLMRRENEPGGEGKCGRYGLDAQLFSPDVRLQVSLPVPGSYTRVPRPPRKKSAKYSPPPRFISARSLPLVEEEQRKHADEWEQRDPVASPVYCNLGAVFTRVDFVGQQSAAELCGPRLSPLLPPAKLHELPRESQGRDKTVDEIAISPDTSAPELVDWHVLMEESIILDLTVGSEGVDEGMPLLVRSLESPLLTTNKGWGGGDNVDGTQSISTPHEAAAEEEETMLLHSQSPLQRNATGSPPSRGSDVVVYPTSLPPSISPMESNSFDDECDEDGFKGVRREAALQKLLGRLAAKNDNRLQGGGVSEFWGKLPFSFSSPMLSSPISEKNGSLTHHLETRHSVLAPLWLVVELCRALRPFARRLLLMLAQESGGRADVLCDTCAEVVNSILEAEGVCHVRASRNLCRSIASIGSTDATDGHELLSYANFVAGVMQLAGDTK
ncbi:hypothetical protein TcCL_ESM02961 [Trypanosoma cruzi]|uniref:Uncharacterized protein n=1 Tax=Trypanosoma cruzi (strain CL Brener) TaxID=353153 RepID=Q4D788_TRYCC|nr:hypothetical protein, conserved [Trypanosoma cruzi]EAN88391.1 hypothetical protein, conserved [Trypanosoma cruzi]RNC59386.1 hypothetical protein TcCL_ESM02961 [Trypanosoma cruzi]|eukprot:XP_810242.1 hypothetical protein [Trypanosoma cruzi strain CL Brener]